MRSAEGPSGSDRRLRPLAGASVRVPGPASRRRWCIGPDAKAVNPLAGPVLVGGRGHGVDTTERCTDE
jgi:hypothetical protein